LKDLDHVVLVGHSFRGMMITSVAERMRERIDAMPHLDALISADGQTMAMLRNTAPNPLLARDDANAAGGRFEGQRIRHRLS